MVRIWCRSPNGAKYFGFYATGGQTISSVATSSSVPTPVVPAPVPLAPPPAVKLCSVPKLSHLSLTAAKAALAKAGCVLGKIKKEKRPKSTAGLSYGVLAESPAAGSAVALNSEVNVTLGWFKRPKSSSQKH